MNEESNPGLKLIYSMQHTRSSKNISKLLWTLLTVYFLASLAHFTHNAEFIDAYPNLPIWLTRPMVYLAWLSVTAVGIIGILLLSHGFRISGIVVLIFYAALGFAGLDHYWATPFSSHTPAMNASIWFEVVAAAFVLIALLAQLLSISRSLHREKLKIRVCPTQILVVL